MIGGRGHTRTRRTLITLFCVVVGIACLAYFAPRRLSSRDPETEAVLQAAAAVHKRVSEPRKDATPRLPVLPAAAQAAPSPPRLPAAGVLRIIRDGDVELLRLLENACLTRDDDARKDTYRVISEGLAKAASTQMGSTLVKELAAHRDSPDEILRVVGEYLSADAELIGAERAVAAGEYDAVALSPLYNYRTSDTLLNKMTLRALAELRRDEDDKAVFSCVQGYYLSRLRMEKEFHPWLRSYPGLDLLLEKVIDAAWRRETPAAQARQILVEAVRWHPESKCITDYVCERVGAESRFGEVLRHPLEVFQVTAEWGSSYQHDQVLIGTLERTMGRRPFEVGGQARALEAKVPVEAPTTKTLTQVAFLANQSFWERELKADLTQLVFALKDLRRARGSYPTSLDQADPRVSGLVPTDPGSGRPVRYEPNGAGFKLVRESVTGRVAVAWEAAE